MNLSEKDHHHANTANALGARDPARVIRIAAALVCRGDGRTLLVRKRGTTKFMQPGGKIEIGEEPIHAVVRELREELELTVMPNELSHLGSFVAPAANEPGWQVQAEVFQVDIRTEVVPAAEIEEIIWVDPTAPGIANLAPLTSLHILPLHVAACQRREAGAALPQV